MWHGVALGADSELIDRIVAVVDEEVILWSELNYRVQLELQQAGYGYLPAERELDRLLEQALGTMIDEQVLIHKAVKDSIQIDESQVEEILNDRYRQLKDGMEAAEFDEKLERSGLSERQFKARLRKEIRHGLLFDQMRQEVAFRLHITRKDVEAYRQAHHDTLPPMIFLSQILLKVKPDSVKLAEVRQKIQVIEQKLEAGEDFADLARSYSEHLATRSDGGNLGCFEAGLMMPEFEKAAFQLKPGEVSDPVLTRHGYHLIQLHEKREDELCASHILILAQTSQQDKVRTRDKLEELRQRALAGEDFGQLARTYSEDRQSAAQGGLWNVFGKDQIPPSLQPYTKHLKLGEISEPYFLEDGGHILRINDDHAILERTMRETRLTETMRNLIDNHKNRIHVERRMDSTFIRHPRDGTP